MKKLFKKMYVNIAAYSILIFFTLTCFLGTIYLLQVISELVK